MIVRLDSFDHYNVQDQKWNTGSAQASIDLTGTKARTGVGCLIINSGFQGPLANLDDLAQIVMGTALYCNTLGGAFCTLGNAVAPPNFYFTNVQLNVTPTGAISAFAWVAGNLETVATSAAGLITTNMYNYLEWSVVISDAAGSIDVWLNNVLVLSVSGIRTHSPQTDGPNPTPVSCNVYRLLGAGGAGEWRHDDHYVIDPTISPNTSRLGPVRIARLLPSADSTPLEWTPSAGTDHFDLVNNVPPNSATFVEDSTVGHTDQYLYDASQIPANASIFGVQHMLNSALDAAGSGSVGSSVNGVVTGSLALSTSYVMLREMYNVNPATGVAWTGPDILAIKAGPSVTA